MPSMCTRVLISYTDFERMSSKTGTLRKMKPQQAGRVHFLQVALLGIRVTVKEKNPYNLLIFCDCPVMLRWKVIYEPFSQKDVQKMSVNQCRTQAQGG